MLAVGLFVAGIAYRAKNLDLIARNDPRRHPWVSAGELARIDAFLRAQSRLPLDTRFSAGSPWGMRQARLLDTPLADGLDFGVEPRHGVRLLKKRVWRSVG